MQGLCDDSPFDQLQSIQREASRIAHSNPYMPMGVWSEDYSQLALGGKIVDIMTFRVGNENALADATSAYEAITKCRGYFAPLQETVVDDIANRTKGYWFGQTPQITAANQAFFLHIAEAYADLIDPSLPSTSVGSPRMSLQGATVLLSKIDNLMDTLFCLIHITGGGSWRGTELETALRTNMDVRRNLFLTPQGLVLVSRYIKTTGLTGKESAVPMFLPRRVAALFYETQVGGLHQLRVSLAEVVYDKKTAQKYHR